VLGSGRNRHREERSDAAIQSRKAHYVPLDCFASLAMTLSRGDQAHRLKPMADDGLGVATHAQETPDPQVQSHGSPSTNAPGTLVTPRRFTG
jgi:hypothetical protein